MMQIRDLLVFLPVSLSLACSSSSGGSAPDAGASFDGPGASFDGSGPSRDAAKESGPAPDGGSPDGSSSGGTISGGDFLIGEDTLVGSASDVYAGGLFALYPANGTCPPAPAVPSGCSYDDCYSGPKSEKALSAGTVSVTGGTPTMTMTQNSQGAYSFSQQTGELAGSGMLTFSATGGDVPAFTVSIPKIAYASLTAPAQNQNVPRSQDLTVSWTGGTPGASVYLRVLNNQQEVTCVFDAAAGTGTVPSALLQKLPAASNTPVTFSGFAQASVMAGSVPVHVNSFHKDIMASDITVNLQ